MASTTRLTALTVGAIGTLCIAQACAVDATTESDGELLTVGESLTCNDYNGVNPVKAAMAVAMARELGEIDALKYFAWSGGTPWGDASSKLVLSSTGESKCGTSTCPILRSLLALQNSAVNQVVSTAALDVLQLRNDLYLSFDRQRARIQDLTWNSPSSLPEAHTLKLVGTVDKGGCGLHYEFDAFKAGTTTPLSKPANLANNLYFFGISTGNAFLAFYSTDGGIGLDPTVSLTGTVQSAGSCGSGFSIYDPSWYSYGKCCYYNSKYGTWAVASWAANTFYCKV